MADLLRVLREAGAGDQVTKCGADGGDSLAQEAAGVRVRGQQGGEAADQSGPLLAGGCYPGGDLGP